MNVGVNVGYAGYYGYKESIYKRNQGVGVNAGIELQSEEADVKEVRASMISDTESREQIKEGAVKLAKEELEGEFLGLTMVPEENKQVAYGMRAMLPATSTEENPIVQVVSNLGGEKKIYDIDISKVDPNNATSMEMFALLSYSDKMGYTDGGTFGSHQQLETYGMNASRLGYCKEMSGEYNFANKDFNWTEIISKMRTHYYESGIMNQHEDCNKLLDFLQDKIKEIFAKIENGDTENTYQIGSKTYTEEEWDSLLANFDSIEEATRELMREAYEKRADKVKDKEVENDEENANVDTTLLTSPSTSCTYHTNNPDDNDIKYLTWYTEDGIYCRKSGQTEGYEWVVNFENEEKYKKAINFIEQFPSDWNLRFAAHENFWKDYLSGEIDEEAFMDFMKSTNKGVPDYSVKKGDSMFVDREKLGWAQYLNPLGNLFYTAEEMKELQTDVIRKNTENKKKITEPYEVVQ